MDKAESSSTIDSLEGKMNTIRDEEKLDIVTALTTPLQQTIIKKHAETLKKLKSQEKEIRQQQQQIDELNFELSIKDAHMQNIRNETKIPITPSLPPALAASETPGPHRLQMKPERPEDIAYRAKLAEQQHAEEAMGNQDSPASQDALLSVFQSLTKVLKDNNQHLQSSDVTEPTKFNGLDTQWDDFYLQLRTYLEAKGWLDTFDHKTGPGTPGNNTEINKKIYRLGAGSVRGVTNNATTAADAIEKNITPLGGFPFYGEVNQDYLLIRGQVMGTKKRAIVLRKSLFPTTRNWMTENIELKFIDTASKLGHGRFQTFEEKDKFLGPLKAKEEVIKA